MEKTASGPVGALTKRERRLQPLKSEINLHPHPKIKGFPAQKRKRKPPTKSIADDDFASRGAASSSDDEFDTSVSHKAMVREYNGRLMSRAKKHPRKAVAMSRVITKNIWSDDDDGKYDVIM